MLSVTTSTIGRCTSRTSRPAVVCRPCTLGRSGGKRLREPGIVFANAPMIFALVHALETAGIEFTNGERPGVRSGGPG